MMNSGRLFGGELPSNANFRFANRAIPLVTMSEHPNGPGRGYSGAAVSAVGSGGAAVPAACSVTGLLGSSTRPGVETAWPLIAASNLSRRKLSCWIAAGKVCDAAPEIGGC